MESIGQNTHQKNHIYWIERCEMGGKEGSVPRGTVELCAVRTEAKGRFEPSRGELNRMAGRVRLKKWFARGVDWLDVWH